MATWQGTTGQKEDLKKATAKMMVFWAVHTRRDLRDEVINQKLDGQWVETGVPDVLGSEEWPRIVSIVSAFIKEPTVRSIMDAGFGISYPEWAMGGRNGIHPCPTNEIIRAMIKGAMDTIESEWQVSGDGLADEIGSLREGEMAGKPGHH